MRRIPRVWEHCPNCDAPLGKRIFVGDDWECAECGEGGQREPGQYDTIPMYFAWDWDTIEFIPVDDESPF